MSPPYLQRISRLIEGKWPNYEKKTDRLLLGPRFLGQMRRWLDSDLPKFQNIKCSYSYCQLVVMRGASCDCKTFSYISYHESCLKKENNKRKRSKCGTKAETEMSVPIQNRKKHKKQSTKQTKQKRLKQSSGTNVNGLIGLLNLGPLGQVLCLDFS